MAGTCAVAVSAATVVQAPSVADAGVGRPVYTRVETAGDGAVAYRAPALAITARGVLVACYDSRSSTARDLPNVIDVLCRRSTDGGATWSPRAVAARHSGGDQPSTAYGVGDPDLTYDRTTGALLLSYVAAPPGVGYRTAAPSNRPGDGTTLHPTLRESVDDGRSWSPARDLTEQLKTPATGGIFASSGKGLQLADGTLAVPYDYRIGDQAYAAYATSRDHGRTWRMQPPLGPGVGEHKGVQLRDGTLLDWGRPASGGRRLRSTAPGPAGPWSPPVGQVEVPDAGCNGDILRVDPDPASPRSDWLVSSTVAGPRSRSDLVVRLSRDGGRTWHAALTVEPGPAAYSTLVRLPDGDIGVLYEHGGLEFARFPLDAVGAPSGGPPAT